MKLLSIIDNNYKFCNPFTFSNERDINKTNINFINIYNVLVTDIKTFENIREKLNNKCIVFIVCSSEEMATEDYTKKYDRVCYQSNNARSILKKLNECFLTSSACIYGNMNLLNPLVYYCKSAHLIKIHDEIGESKLFGNIEDWIEISSSLPSRDRNITFSYIEKLNNNVAEIKEKE